MDGFDSAYWNLAQVEAWVRLRNRDLIGRLGAEADPLRRLADTIATSAEGGPGENPNMTSAQGAVLNAARAGHLHPLGVENGLGDHKEIPTIQLAGLAFYFGGDGKAFAGLENGLRPGGTCWRDLKFARSEVLVLWPEMQVHEVEPLVLIDDGDVTHRAGLPHWTLTEALFLLSGHRPPGYESVRHMQDHFWSAYIQAVRAIDMGSICRKIERAGECIFVDSPANWLAWADNLRPKYIEVDERVRREVQEGNTPVDDRTSTIRAETACQRWLQGLMANGSHPDRRKKEYEAQAREKFGTGARAFERAWANAVTSTENTNWTRPGRKS